MISSAAPLAALHARSCCTASCLLPSHHHESPRSSTHPRKPYQLVVRRQPSGRDDLHPHARKAFDAAHVSPAGVELHPEESRDATVTRDPGGLFKLSHVRDFSCQVEVRRWFRRFKYISPATQIAILGELTNRVEFLGPFRDDDARTTLESTICYAMQGLFKSPDSRVPRRTFSWLTSLGLSRVLLILGNETIAACLVGLLR
jgi:hypothetical protein